MKRDRQIPEALPLPDGTLCDTSVLANPSAPSWGQNAPWRRGGTRAPSTRKVRRMLARMGIAPGAFEAAKREGCDQ